MIHQKKVSVGNFLKKGIDFKDGDILEIASEGKEVQGQFNLQTLIMVKIGDKEGNVNFNQTSLNSCIDSWGEDDLKWIGKKVKAHKIKQNVAGKFVDVWYFAHPVAELTESGFVLGKSDTNNEEIEDEEIPFVE
jgi:hypothetical protein